MERIVKMKSLTPARAVKNVLSGAVVGVANVIPGVSGGTMAVVLNVFDEMMETLGLKKFKKNLGFLLTFGLGAVAGIVLFSSAITWLLGHYPVATNFTFIGLVLGSIPMIFRRARGTRIGPSNVIAFLVGFGVMLALALVNQDSFSQSRDTVLTLQNGLQLFFVSALASIAMILPGISGSLIMVILGTYYTVTGAVSDFVSSALRLVGGEPAGAALLQSLLLLLPALLGIVLGLVFGSRLIDYVVKKAPQMAYSTILGLIVGSFFALVPRSFAFNGEGIVAILLLIAGTAAAYLFSRTAKD